MFDPIKFHCMCKDTQEMRHSWNTGIPKHQRKEKRGTDTYKTNHHENISMYIILTPLNTTFIIKLGFTGVHVCIIFLISARKYILWVLVRTALPNRLAEAVLTSTHNLCFEQKFEKYQNFYLKTFRFWWYFQYIWIGGFFLMRHIWNHQRANKKNCNREMTLERSASK